MTLRHDRAVGVSERRDRGDVHDPWRPGRFRRLEHATGAGDVRFLHRAAAFGTDADLVDRGSVYESVAAAEVADRVRGGGGVAGQEVAAERAERRGAGRSSHQRGDGVAPRTQRARHSAHDEAGRAGHENPHERNTLAPSGVVRWMTDRMPALFIGHGSPMNALVTNKWTEDWKALGESLPRPRAIVAISAHWYTDGTGVTAVSTPRTIHDFGGFPRELFEVQYPAPGDPELAKDLTEILAPTPVVLDSYWGLDPGTWSVLVRMFPNADIPVVQLSIDATAPPRHKRP